MDVLNMDSLLEQFKEKLIKKEYHEAKKMLEQIQFIDSNNEEYLYIKEKFDMIMNNIQSKNITVNYIHKFNYDNSSIYVYIDNQKQATINSGNKIEGNINFGEHTILISSKNRKLREISYIFMVNDNQQYYIEVWQHDVLIEMRIYEGNNKIFDSSQI